MINLDTPIVRTMMIVLVVIFLVVSVVALAIAIYASYKRNKFLDQVVWDCNIVDKPGKFIPHVEKWCNRHNTRAIDGNHCMEATLIRRRDHPSKYHQSESESA